MKNVFSCNLRSVLRTCLPIYSYNIIIFSVGVHVLVQDVNEYAPEWVGHELLDGDNENESAGGMVSSPSTLRVEVEEGQLLDHIVRVEAVDKDCSPRFGDVCGYEILQTAGSDQDDEENRQPFTINSDGKCLMNITYFCSSL